MRRCTSPWLLIASELGRSNADAWILEEGLACPNKHSLITYNGNTHPHQNPNRVLPNSSMYNSTLAMSLRCGRSHWLPLVAAPLLPTLSQEQEDPAPLGSACCATEPTRDKCHVFPQEQLEETNREDVPCATLYTVTLLLSQISVSKKFHIFRKY